MVTWVCHNCYPNMVGGLFSSGRKYGPLGSLLVTFHGVVEFISLNFFCTGDVAIKVLLCLLCFFSLLYSLSSLLSPNVQSISLFFYVDIRDSDKLCMSCFSITIICLLEVLEIEIGGIIAILFNFRASYFLSIYKNYY
jgi:hypothetical protein